MPYVFESSPAKRYLQVNDISIHFLSLHKISHHCRLQQFGMSTCIDMLLRGLKLMSQKHLAPLVMGCLAVIGLIGTHLVHCRLFSVCFPFFLPAMVLQSCRCAIVEVRCEGEPRPETEMTDDRRKKRLLASVRPPFTHHPPGHYTTASPFSIVIHLRHSTSSSSFLVNHASLFMAENCLCSWSPAEQLVWNHLSSIICWRLPLLIL